MPTPVRAIGITHMESPRHGRFVKMLEGLGIPFELSPAVFVRGEPPWSSHYDHDTRMRNLGYPMRPGEIGCFLAHRAAWETASRHEGCTLVLEDDAFVEPSRRTAILGAAGIISGRPSAARLISQPRPSFRTWRQVAEKAALVRPTRHGNLTVGYLITQEGAWALLRKSESFWCPVDDYMNLEYVHGCLMLHFEPEIAEHRDGGVSLIGGRTKPSVALRTRIVRELLRAWRNVRGRLFSWIVLLRLGLCFRRIEDPVPR
jgi:glycosyl transferase family 25